METALYELTFKDGRVFRVFAGNKHQKMRLHAFIQREDNCLYGKKITNGIHTIKQFETIMNTTKDGKK